MDVLTKEQRRKNMQAIKSKDTKIEMLLRHALWKKGYRYRKNYTRVTGKPDIAFPGLKIAIFCDSEFWHGFDWENSKYKISTNKKFWIKKIESNIARDHFVNKKLKEEGWIVLRIWEKEIKKNLSECLFNIEHIIDERKKEFSSI